MAPGSGSWACISRPRVISRAEDPASLAAADLKAMYLLPLASRCLQVGNPDQRACGDGVAGSSQIREAICVRDLRGNSDSCTDSRLWDPNGEC